jgi:superfamily II DNA/RNA helicase
LPPTATVGFFSASFSNQIRETCKKWRPDVEEFIRREVPRVIDHFYTVVRDPDQAAPQILKQYYCAQVDSGQAIVFFAQKERVKEFVGEMNDAKFTCRAIHGEVPFDERRQTISDFRDEKFKVLAATDIIARGFDVPQVFLVVQVGVRWEGPDDEKTGGDIGTNYQHRAGRAGRYGRTGACLSIVSRREIRMLQDIEKDLNIQITELRPDQVVALPKETEVVSDPAPAPRRAQTQAPQ